MKTLTINIPDNVEMDEREVKIFLAAKLFERGKLSIGQAAEIADLSKRSFMEVIGNYGVSIFNYSSGDLDSDVCNAADYHL